MRGLRLEVPGIAGLRIAELPEPEPQAGEVLIRLKAAALNHRDLWSCLGWKERKPSPVLGSDGAGVIERVGREVRDWQAGQEVVVNPSLHWPGDSPVPGQNFEILGIPSDGTFAELVSVPAGQVAPKPSHLDWSQAAALPLSGLTGYRALFTVGELRKNDTCVIVGIGGGTALQTLLLAKAAGARLAVTSRDPAKRRRAETLGAELALDSTVDWAEALRQWTDDRGADVIIENVCRPSWQHSLAALARGGRLVVYGSTGGDMVETNLVPLFLGWRSIRGTTMGNAAEFERMLAFVAQHRITPVIDRVYAFAEGIEAFRRLDRGEQFGKIVLSFEG